MTKTPEQWLEEVSPQERTKGILKLFLGYAPGVGKTYGMLSEAIRRRSRGEDVVIGVVETHGRKGIQELAPQLEQVPRKKIEYKGTIFEEMDTDAILVRNPRVILVDELAHTNIPGSKHRKRYEDVLELVEAKMEVLSTVNIQHLESIAPTVSAITGIKIRETVPDWVLEHANEIVMVDLTPEALQNRMRRGEVYHTGKVDQALKNFDALEQSGFARLADDTIENFTRSGQPVGVLRALGFQDGPDCFHGKAHVRCPDCVPELCPALAGVGRVGIARTAGVADGEAAIAAASV